MCLVPDVWYTGFCITWCFKYLCEVNRWTVFTDWRRRCILEVSFGFVVKEEGPIASSHLGWHDMSTVIYNAFSKTMASQAGYYLSWRKFLFETWWQIECRYVQYIVIETTIQLLWQKSDRWVLLLLTVYKLSWLISECLTFKPNKISKWKSYFLKLLPLISKRRFRDRLPSTLVQFNTEPTKLGQDFGTNHMNYTSSEQDRNTRTCGHQSLIQTILWTMWL